MEFQHDVRTYDSSINPDGSMHVAYTGSCVVMPKIDFNDLIHRKQQNEALQDRVSQLESANKSLKKSSQTAVETASDDFLSSHRGGYDKQGCGRRADAEMIAKAVGGASVDELLKGRYTYDKYGHRRAYSRGRIFKALSVKKPEDYERITSLINDFPDVFVSVGVEAVYCWMQKKASKGGKNL